MRIDKIVACCCLLLTVEVGAQQWCVPGSLWYHEETEYAMSGQGSYVETRYMGDVLFADSLCQQLSYTVYAYHEPSGSVQTPEWGEFYTTTHAGVVYLWEQTRFDTLYNFTAGPGDHWGIPSPVEEVSGLKVTVLDTGHASIDGQHLTYQVVRVMGDDGSTYISVDTLFERIGPFYMYCIMGYSQGLVTDGGFHSLRCYNDDEITFTRVEGRCDVGLGIDARPQQEKVSLFPTPAFDRLWLDGQDAEGTIRVAVHNMQGSIVLLESMVPQTGLDVSILAPGFYTIAIPTHGGQELRLRWIKE